jgi:hypothetical protein
MSKLPFILPDRDLNLNMALVLLIFKHLGLSPRGIPLLNNERISVFFYFVKNPTILERTLSRYGRGHVALNYDEAASINSIAVNLDSLFDRKWIKTLVKHLVARNLIKPVYRQKEGFVFQLSEGGSAVAESLSSEYFLRISYFLSELNSLKSESTSAIHKMLNQTFREEG